MDVGSHLSPRMRMELTSSPTSGGHQGTKPKPGRRVALMSDIFEGFLGEALDLRWKETEYLKYCNHPTAFISVRARIVLLVGNRET